MFCRVCGTENGPSAVYCKRDGELLYKPASVSPQKKDCCVSYINAESPYNYCPDCGDSLNHYEAGTKAYTPSIKDVVGQASSLSNGFSKERVEGMLKAAKDNFAIEKIAWKQVAIVLAITFALLLLMSRLIFNSIKQSFLLSDPQSAVLFNPATYMQQEGVTFHGAEPEAPFGLWDILMLAHGSSLSLDLSVMTDQMSLSIGNGLMFAIWLPVLALITGGYLLARTTAGGWAEKIHTYGAFVMAYAVLIFIIARFAGYSYRGSVSDEWTDMGVISLSLSYGHIGLLISSLLLATVFASIGYLLHYRTAFMEKWRRNPDIRFGLVTPAAVILSGVLVLSVVLAVMFFNSTFYLTELKPDIDGAVKPLTSFSFYSTIFLQGAAYIWMLMNFQSLELGVVMSAGFPSVTFSVSAFDGWSIPGEEMAQSFFYESLSGSALLNSETWLFYSMGIPLALFLLIGYLMFAYYGRDYRKVFLFSVPYAVLMTILGVLISFSYSIKEITGYLDGPVSLHFGFSFISTLVITLVATSLLVYLGMYIRELLERKKV